MKKYPIDTIIKRFTYNDILGEYEIFECFDALNPDEYAKLRKRVCGQELLAFVVSMAIMYVNTGLLYAKAHLSKQNFDNFMMWIDIFDDIEPDWCDCKVCFTRDASPILEWLKTPIDYRDEEELNGLQQVHGLNDFYCFRTDVYNDGENVYYSFVPKVFIENSETEFPL